MCTAHTGSPRARGPIRGGAWIVALHGWGLRIRQPVQLNGADIHGRYGHPVRHGDARGALDPLRIPVQARGDRGQLGAVPVQGPADEAPVVRLLGRRLASARGVVRLGQQPERLRWEVHRLGEPPQLSHVVAPTRTTDVLRHQRPVHTENRRHLTVRGETMSTHVRLDHHTKVRRIPRRPPRLHHDSPLLGPSTDDEPSLSSLQCPSLLDCE